MPIALGVLTTLVAIALFLLWFLKTPAEKVAQRLRKTALIAAIVIVILLAATGRLHWLFALAVSLVGALIPFGRRLLPLLIRYAPLLFSFYRRNKRQQNAKTEAPTSRTTMSLDEAYSTLNLKPGASREEIIEAHRRLMQKNHPDHGGSTYLATKINQAKDMLLKKRESP